MGRKLEIDGALKRRLMALKDMPAAQQAALLGLTVAQVRHRRSLLQREGKLPRRRRRATAGDRARVLRLWETTHLSLHGIAERVDFSPRFVQQVIHDAGKPPRRTEAWTQRGVAELFGVQPQRVGLWMAQEWLLETPARGNERGGGVASYVTRHDLVAFVQERRGWPTYKPDAIQDADLRQLARTVRATAGGSWVPMPVLARRAGLTRAGLSRRRRAGWMAGWEFYWVLSYGYVWWPDGATLPPFDDVTNRRAAAQAVQARKRAERAQCASV